jgi:hypothetical protein
MKSSSRFSETRPILHLRPFSSWTPSGLTLPTSVSWAPLGSFSVAILFGTKIERWRRKQQGVRPGQSDSAGTAGGTKEEEEMKREGKRLATGTYSRSSCAGWGSWTRSSIALSGRRHHFTGRYLGPSLNYRCWPTTRGGGGAKIGCLCFWCLGRSWPAYQGPALGTFVTNGSITLTFATAGSVHGATLGNELPSRTQFLVPPR